MKILLINAYSVHNIGDGAIVGCMIKLARSVYPNAQIDVMSSYAEQNRPTYDIWNVKSLNSIWDLNQPAKFGRIGQYLRWLKLSAGAMLSGNAASLKAFKDADAEIDNEPTNPRLWISIGPHIEFEAPE